ncbi:MAG: hypothetical protein LBK71_10490, partial [Verrucomicrobiales bacterium]|nr:hypothetical protein [Verrucomicrobiales bacterium]
MKQWVAALGVICGLAAGLPGAMAAAGDNMLITTATTVVESNTTHLSNGTTYAPLQVSNPGAVYSGTNITLTATAAGDSHGRRGVVVSNQGSVSIFGGTITTTGPDVSNGHGVYASGSSSFVGNDLVVIGAANSYASYGLYASAAVITGSNVAITTSGSSDHAVQSIEYGVINLTDVRINTSGHNADGLRAYRDGTIYVTGGEINTSGSWAAGVDLLGGRTSYVVLTNVNVTTTGSYAQAILANSGTGNNLKTLVINGGTFRSAQGYGIGINVPHNLGDAAEYLLQSGTVDITVRGGAEVSGGAGGLYATSIRTGTDSSGQLVEVDTPLLVNINLETAASLDGDISLLSSTTTTLTLSDTASLTGDLTASGSTITTVNLANGTLAGDVTANDEAVITITGTAGSAIVGDVTGNDNAVIDVTVTGSDSTFTGDIARNDDAVVTITIDHGATGSGGFNGGNLITGEDSTWTFNQDSHGNNGENHGTWNIGDYNVTFDNLDHTGTINISVNSDTGEGGSITVDTADGEGTVHIDTTGNGKADPNQVLPGKVTGDGTENWQWDPIDWGIDTIIKDGDHFIKQGTSPAGAVLNSSVAIQQAMWFAQQNSLLKRMGELRYGARASRP